MKYILSFLSGGIKSLDTRLREDIRDMIFALVHPSGYWNLNGPLLAARPNRSIALPTADPEEAFVSDGSSVLRHAASSVQLTGELMTIQLPTESSPQPMSCSTPVLSPCLPGALDSTAIDDSQDSEDSISSIEWASKTYNSPQASTPRNLHSYSIVTPPTAPAPLTSKSHIPTFFGNCKARRASLDNLDGLGVTFRRNPDTNRDMCNISPRRDLDEVWFWHQNDSLSICSYLEAIPESCFETQDDGDSEGGTSLVEDPVDPFMNTGNPSSLSPVSMSRGAQTYSTTHDTSESPFSSPISPASACSTSLPRGAKPYRHIIASPPHRERLPNSFSSSTISSTLKRSHSAHRIGLTRSNTMPIWRV